MLTVSMLASLNLFAISFQEEKTSLCHAIKVRDNLSIQSHRLTSFKRHFGCSHRVPWIQELKKIVCNEEIQTQADISTQLDQMSFPKYILIHFAGASDFNAKYVNGQINPINLTGWEGRDLIGRNWSGKLFKKLFYQEGSPLKREDYLIQYYAGSEFKHKHSRETGKACARQTYEYFDYIKKYNSLGEVSPKVIISGYSNGAAMAVDTQLYLGKMGYSVDLVLSLDPVVKASRFLFSSKSGYYRSKHPNTKRLINFYQRRDLGSLAVLPLRGHPVKGADENIKVDCKTSKGIRCNGWLNHSQLTRTSLVLETMTQELSRL